MIQTTLNIKAHGKIESLTKEFSFPYKEDFTVYVRPKDNAEVGNDIVLSVKLHNEEKFSNVPIAVGQWSPLSIKAIAGNQNDILNSVDLYWGGQTMPKPGTGRIIKNPTEKALAYTGEAQALVNAGSGTGTMLYKLGDGEWSENIPTATNAGFYTVHYKCASNDMYSESPTYSVVCQIAKASRTIAFTSVPQNVTVEEDYSLAATPSAGASDGTITYRSSNQEVVYVNGSTATGVAAGTCSIIASISGGVNYEDAEISQAVTAEAGHNYANDYLTLIPSESANFSFTRRLEYSLDNGETWTELAGSSNTPTIAAGKKVLWKGNLAGTASETNGIGSFSCNKEFTAEGNVMSIYAGDNFRTTESVTENCAFMKLFYGSYITSAENLKLPKTSVSYYCCKYMFGNCTHLVTAPSSLPATSLSLQCYQEMFSCCISLTSAPLLPATVLAESCYRDMFYQCSALTTAPSLPATELAAECYRGMFSACHSLTSVPELPATKMKYHCYHDMFDYCRSLKRVPKLPATELEEACYRGMFYQCLGLEFVDELPATTLVTECYQSMFQGCELLHSVKAAFTTTPSDSYTKNWLDGVCLEGNFYKNANADWNVVGVNGIPSGWTVETYTPSN